jgi:hypothetical protein
MLIRRWCWAVCGYRIQVIIMIITIIIIIIIIIIPSG